MERQGLPQTRRDFLADVGKGMLAASVGTALAAEIGISPALANPSYKSLDFGRLEPLVQLMQENSADKMLVLAVDQLNNGTEIRDLVAAAALANARTFGGEDYVGFHAFMALVPAFDMSSQLPADRRALPVLKVLYRSTNQIRNKGGRTSEVLHTVTPTGTIPDTQSRRREALVEAMLRQDLDGAEDLFAGIAARSSVEAFNDVQALIQEEADVHRVVMAYRAWDLLGLTGKEHAHTTLRQSVHYCVTTEKSRIAHGYPVSGIRVLLPTLMEQYRLADRSPGSKEGDDTWVHSLSETLLYSHGDQAAEAVASALSEGFSLDSIGEALSLAATQQVLRDKGRTEAYPGKPVGSVHGDSPGVHASDSMNAWRNIARVSEPYNALAGLVVAGYHIAAPMGRDWKQLPAIPLHEQLEAVQTHDPAELLKELGGAIRENNQAGAAAIAQRYGDLGHSPKPVFAMLLGYATSEDGALHAEKYYRTVSEEFARTRKAYRWSHLVALARVTASEYGKRADGYEQACGLLRIKA